MRRQRGTAVVVVALILGIVIGVAFAEHSPSSASAETAVGSSFVPACPTPLYTADGNVSPLFCKIDNPLAVRFYKSIAPNVFALGPDASPSQVEDALKVADAHGTNPEMCAVYQLAAWWKHWRFGVSPGQAYCG